MLLKLSKVAYWNATFLSIFLTLNSPRQDSIDNLTSAFKAFPADENWFCQLCASKQLYRAEVVIFTMNNKGRINRWKNVVGWMMHTHGHFFLRNGKEFYLRQTEDCSLRDTDLRSTWIVFCWITQWGRLI